MALTQTQEKIARFIIQVEKAQPSGSLYFAADGGVSIQKVAGNLGMTVTAVQSDVDAMGSTLVTQTTRTSGVGLKPTAQLKTDIGVIDAANAQAVADAEAANFLPSNRATAKETISLTVAEGMKVRAIALITIDEINLLRKWIRDFKVEVAAATTLADLKTRVAALNGMSDRTLAQLKTAYENKIDAGNAD